MDIPFNPLTYLECLSRSIGSPSLQTEQPANQKQQPTGSISDNHQPPTVVNGLTVSVAEPSASTSVTTSLPQGFPRPFLSSDEVESYFSSHNLIDNLGSVDVGRRNPEKSSHSPVVNSLKLRVTEPKLSTLISDSFVQAGKKILHIQLPEPEGSGQSGSVEFGSIAANGGNTVKTRKRHHADAKKHREINPKRERYSKEQQERRDRKVESIKNMESKIPTTKLDSIKLEHKKNRFTQATKIAKGIEYLNNNRRDHPLMLNYSSEELSDFIHSKSPYILSKLPCILSESCGFPVLKRDAVKCIAASQSRAIQSTYFETLKLASEKAAASGDKSALLN
ncbi:hypothetical protein [Endozoicomonas sp.]|uniref:hypothetical protein n=1 Tax=Endozoicomonas sp. TaxID=1892382 RepID=UPI00383A4580